MNSESYRAVHLSSVLRDDIAASGLGSPRLVRQERLAIRRSVALYDAIITNPDLRECTRDLFADEHYKQAVEAAFVCVDNQVRSRSGQEQTGVKLMNNVFSTEKPVLRLNQLRSQSDKDEQDGYRFLFSGGMAGIRNPRAHNHDLRDDPDAALEMLVIANHLLRVLSKAKKARRSRS